MDNNYIDLTAHNSSAGGALQKPGSSYYLSTKPSQGWVNIGGNRHYSGSQTGLTVKNGPVFVGGSNSCNYTSYTANNQCQSNSSTYPKSGQVSAKDYYVKNYSQPNTPLSVILSHMNQRINRNAQNIASNSSRISQNRNSINNIGVIQGPPGPQGPRGPRGPPGPPGTGGSGQRSTYFSTTKSMSAGGYAQPYTTTSPHCASKSAYIKAVQYGIQTEYLLPGQKFRSRSAHNVHFFCTNNVPSQYTIKKNIAIKANSTYRSNLPVQCANNSNFNFLKVTSGTLRLKLTVSASSGFYNQKVSYGAGSRIKAGSYLQYDYGRYNHWIHNYSNSNATVNMYC